MSKNLISLDLAPGRDSSAESQVIGPRWTDNGTGVMTPEQFETYCQRLMVPDLGKQYLEIVRNGRDGEPAAPFRAVESRVGNMIVRYASAKNRKALPLESRRVEFAIALILENDDDVLEYWTQPAEIRLSYLSANDRKVLVDSKADILALRRNRIELIEGKPADRMPELVRDHPGRYQAVDKMHWRCAPGEQAAENLGFSFRMWTDADFTRERIRNLKYWDPFLKLGPFHFAESAWRPVQEFVLARPGISLDELGKASGAQGQTIVRWMLAHRLIFFDLDKFVLATPDRTRVYPNASVAKAMEILRVPEPRWPSVLDTSAPQSQPAVLLELTRALLTHGKGAFAQAYRRWMIVQGFIPREEWDATPRTVTRWRRAYKNHGLLGLLPNRDRTQGNKLPKIDPAVVKVADEFITKHFLTAPKKPINAIYVMVCDACKNENRNKPAQKRLKKPSRAWFYSRIELLEKQKVVKAQEGSRASYPFEFNPKSLAGLWDSRGD